MSRILRVLMATLLLFSTPGYAAKAGSCGPLFLGKNAAREDLKQILLENYDVHETSLLQKLILKYSARKLNQNLGSTGRELKEKIVQIDRWIQIAESLGTSSEKGTHLERDWIRREVLSRSIAQIMDSYGYKTAESRNIFRKIFSNRAVRFLLNPAELPFVADKEIPPALIERMFREGPEAVKLEVQAHYHSARQYHVDAYRSVAKIYQRVALVLFAILAWQHFEDSLENQNENQKEQLNKSLDDLDEMLSVLDEEFERRGLYKANN